MRANILPLSIFAVGLAGLIPACGKTLEGHAEQRAAKQSAPNTVHRSEAESDLLTPESATADAPHVHKSTVKLQAPLAGKIDANGTPRMPSWKLHAGYDAMIGNFYLGEGTTKILPVEAPPTGVATLLPERVRRWHGSKPEPCHITLTPVIDGSRGFYFKCVEDPKGPRGWFMPLPKKSPDDLTEWALYFAQK